jgi:tol-pal system protein YbgF
MRRFNQVFYIICLTITTGLLWTYFTFAQHFNSDWESKQEIASLKKDLDDSYFRISLLHHQMKDLEQSVAAVIPKKNYARNKNIQNLMFTLRAPASIQPLDLSNVYFEKGRKNFLEKKFSAAIDDFTKIKEQYPSSAYQVESRFFIAEALFMQRDFKKCAEVIDDMVLQYPDHELTGYILLRLGQISEHNNQREEAQEIYRTVLKHFPQKPLKDQAQTLLQSVVLE